MPKDVEVAIGRIQDAEDVQRIAVMPDVHLASEFCVGTLVATTHLLYPSAVGGDIGCGMAALRFSSSYEVLADRSKAARLLAGLYSAIPTRRHRARAAPDLPAALEGARLSAGLESQKRRDGRMQLGTLGSGNHFVEFQRDEEGWLWLMVHSGSRALGQAIRDFHLRNAMTSSSGLKYLDANSDSGRAYAAKYMDPTCFGSTARVRSQHARASWASFLVRWARRVTTSQGVAIQMRFSRAPTVPAV